MAIVDITRYVKVIISGRFIPKAKVMAMFIIYRAMSNLQLNLILYFVLICV